MKIIVTKAQKHAYTKDTHDDIQNNSIPKTQCHKILIYKQHIILSFHYLFSKHEIYFWNRYKKFTND